MSKADLSDASLLYKISLSQPVTSLKYSPKNQAIAFMDTECSLGIVHFDLASLGKVEKAQKQESDGEINVDDLDIDEDMLEEEGKEKEKPELKEKEPEQEEQQPEEKPVARKRKVQF